MQSTAEKVLSRALDLVRETPKGWDSCDCVATAFESCKKEGMGFWEERVSQGDALHFLSREMSNFGIYAYDQKHSHQDVIGAFERAISAVHGQYEALEAMTDHELLDATYRQIKTVYDDAAPSTGFDLSALYLSCASRSLEFPRYKPVSAEDSIPGVLMDKFGV